MQAFEQAVLAVRFLAVDAVEKAQSGHPGSPMSLAGIGVELFSRYLRYRPDDPAWPNRDRFVLSCGHASMLLYGLLHLAGYGISKQDLQQFRQLGSKTPGHPERELELGIETTTGPLGQGLSNAVGMALAAKLLAARFPSSEGPLFDYRVFVLASDGDLMEGVANEAISLAGHWGLDNLIVIYDDNRITIDGSTELSLSDDVGRRVAACGWDVQHIDGHQQAEVRRALDRATREPQAGQPSFIVARTQIAYGAPTKQNTSAAHGAALGAQEVQAAKKAQGYPLEPQFFVAEEAYRPFRERAEQTRADYERWQRRFAALPAEQQEQWRKLSRDRVPADILPQLLQALDGKADATRVTAGKIQQVAARLVPALIGGSADLDASTKTNLKGAGTIAKGEYGGRNLHYGIREHAMGAISNGLALSGFIPYAATFLIFSDYMRPSVRLAALMRVQTIYVYTHDSIYLGEDGPTHQPIEQLSSLRLIPNLHVFRPADGVEVAAAWAHALRRTDGPTALALTRQSVPELQRRAAFQATEVLDGAYILDDAADPTLVLIATGSEVSVAISAKRLLSQNGQRVRVISAPCLELFAALPEAKREALLGRNQSERPICVSIEAGSTALWRGIVSSDGITIGIDRFGASGPYAELQREFALQPEQVAQRIQDELASRSARAH